MAIKCTICVILMIKLFLTEFCGKNEKGTKSGTAAIHSRFLQEETMSKTSRCSTVQCRSEPSHQRGQVGQQISSPESGNRSESASEDYQQPSTVSAEDRQAHTRTHGHWYVFWVPWTAYWLKSGPLWSVLVFLPLRRPCTRTQCTNSLCHNPPDWFLFPSCATPLKKSPLHSSILYIHSERPSN